MIRGFLKMSLGALGARYQRRRNFLDMTQAAWWGWLGYELEGEVYLRRLEVRSRCTVRRMHIELVTMRLPPVFLMRLRHKAKQVRKRIRSIKLLMSKVMRQLLTRGVL